MYVGQLGADKEIRAAVIVAIRTWKTPRTAGIAHCATDQRLPRLLEHRSRALLATHCAARLGRGAIDEEHRRQSEHEHDRDQCLPAGIRSRRAPPCADASRCTSEGNGPPRRKSHSSGPVFLISFDLPRSAFERDLSATPPVRTSTD